VDSPLNSPPPQLFDMYWACVFEARSSARELLSAYLSRCQVAPIG
jgi:hypothetical protein